MSLNTTNESPASSDYLAFLERVIGQAGEIALQYFRRELAIADKSGGEGKFDPVTRADREVEEFIRREILAHYPDHAVIGEELGTTTSAGAPTWLIDPIDGTRGFLSGLPAWGVLAGVRDAEACLAGAMRQPCLGETWLGDGKRSFLIGAGRRTRMKTRRRKLGDAVVCCTHPDMYATDAQREKFAGVLEKCRFSRFGTDCLGYGMLAAGCVDLVVEGGLSAYDIMPLIPVVQGAGGVITDWQGDTAVNGGMIVAAGDARLHDEVLKLLN